MSHLLTTRNPMSEARRQHIYGKLQSLSVEANDIGEPSLFAGFLIIASCIGAIVAAVLFIGEVF